jgi:UDP-N-acetylmuramoylalanine-D-glutamate ligase
MSGRGRGTLDVFRRVSIIGAARSGIAAARFFVERGASVFVSDTCSREKLDKTLASNGLAGVQ